MSKRRRRSRRKGKIPAAFRLQWAKNRRKAKRAARSVRRRVRRARRRVTVTARRIVRRRRRRSTGKTGAPIMRRRRRSSGGSSVGRRGFFNTGITAELAIGGTAGALAANQLAPRIADMLPEGQVKEIASSTWGQVGLGLIVGALGAAVLKKAGKGGMGVSFLTGAVAERGAGVARSYIAQSQAMNGLGFYGIEGLSPYGIEGLGSQDYSNQMQPDSPYDS